eukprot:2532707-Pyramimonas_sp.AAC.1
MLMTAVVEDATRSLTAGARKSLDDGLLDLLLYADDTLLIGANESHLQELLDATASAGVQYGMSLHWSKFQLIS